MPSKAQLRFEELLAAPDPAALIRSWSNADPPHFEGEWIDFKGGYSGPPSAPPQPLQEHTIKEAWSKALGGFANSGGGLLVWGVDCRPVPSPIDPTRKIDVAGAIKCVPDPLWLQSRLLQLQLGAVEPGVRGVEIKAIKAITEPGGGGFVVCLIPEGTEKPYRSSYLSGDPFYQRIGTNFEVIPTPLLRTLFHPKASARLVLTVDNHPSVGDGPEVYYYRVNVSNRGTASAYDVAIRTEYFSPWLNEAKVTPGRQWKAIKVVPGSAYYAGESPIHPDEERELVLIAFPATGGSVKPYRSVFQFTTFSKDSPRIKSQFSHDPTRKSSNTKDAVEVEEWNTDAGFTR